MREIPSAIIITGTSRGIGKGLAEFFLAKGIRVYGCSRGGSEIEHSAYQHFEVDVSDERSVCTMVAQVGKAERGNRLGLLNNAGIASMNHLWLTPVATVEKLWKTNFLGSFLFLREVSKWMSRQGGGSIVNFTTVARPLNLEGEMAYATSKAALESLTRIAARELQAFNIAVNALGPGPTRTDLLRGVPEGKMDTLLQSQPVSRYTTIEEICHVAEFLLDARTAGITGQVLYFGGVSG